MYREMSAAAAVVALLCWAPSAQGQMLTEQYIPIGQSPGISGKYSYMGQIDAVDTEGRTVTVRGSEGTTRTIKVTEKTWIFVDRSELKEPNTVGDMSDLQPGQRIEINYTDYETKDTAKWIKVAPGG